MDSEKQNLIQKYNEFKAEYGHAPSSREFFSFAKVHDRHLSRAFGSNAFAKLATECGDDPLKFSTDKVSKERILEQWGNILRQERKTPTQADWIFYKCTPEPRKILQNYGLKWGNISASFLEFAKDRSEWADIISLVEVSEEKESDEVPEVDSVGVDEESHLAYVPPIISSLELLSVDESRSLEFEKKVNISFQILGFEIEDLGQGTGRNPDGIAKNREGHFAILLDAKSRKDKYSIGTEDRKFIEYLKKFVPILKKDGYEFFYFLVVSSDFGSLSNTAINNIFRETNVKISFVSAKNLLKIVSDKIQFPNRHAFGNFKELLFNGGLIDDKAIRKYLEQRFS